MPADADVHAVYQYLIGSTEKNRERDRRPYPRRSAARSSLPWGQWWRQVLAIMRLELRKGFRRRSASSCWP